MEKYNCLIFDLDDTLIENDASVKYAFCETLKIFGFPYSDNILNEWLKFDTAYWRAIKDEKKIIPSSMSHEEGIEFLRAQRFVLFFNIKYDRACLINDVYNSLLGVKVNSVPGVKNTLKNLSEKYKILVATNGPKSSALEKIQKSKINPFIEDIVSAEEVGSSKPTKEFLDYIVFRNKIEEIEKMLIIGDTPETDILLGNNSGIDTVWFNRYGKKIPLGIYPTYEISNMDMLHKIL